MAPPGTEQFYLVMLLNYLPGPISFNNLKTHNGTEYQKFQEDAFANELLHNDIEYDVCIKEETLTAMPNQIRRLFVSFLIFGDPADVIGLFYRYNEAMAVNQGQIAERQKRFSIIFELNHQL
jgi:hypothetical protein